MGGHFEVFESERFTLVFFRILKHGDPVGNQRIVGLFSIISNFNKWCLWINKLRYIRTMHTRIIRSYFAYTHMSIRVYAYVNTRLYVPLLCIPISFFIWSIVGQTKDMGMKRLQSKICIIIVKTSCRSMKAITFQVFDHAILWLLLDLKLPNMGRRLKQSLEIPILTRELYVVTKKDLCFGTGHKSFAKYFLSEFSVLNINPHRKNYISGYIWHRSFIQMVKCSFLDEKIVYQSFYEASFTFSYFLLQGKVLCFACVNKSHARCLFVESVWLKLFIQMVKCSFFNQIIVYQSFYGAPLTFNYVLLQGKFLCFGTRRQVACERFV